MLPHIHLRYRAPEFFSGVYLFEMATVYRQLAAFITATCRKDIPFTPSGDGNSADLPWRDVRILAISVLSRSICGSAHALELDLDPGVHRITRLGRRALSTSSRY
jgi:hypothetical protein